MSEETLYWNYMTQLKKEIMGMTEKMERGRCKKPWAVITKEELRAGEAMNRNIAESMTQKFKAYTDAQNNYIRLLKKELKEIN